MIWDRLERRLPLLLALVTPASILGLISGLQFGLPGLQRFIIGWVLTVLVVLLWPARRRVAI